METGKSYVEDMTLGIHYTKDDDAYILSCNEESIYFDQQLFRRTLVDLLDLLEDTLPLGSVVDLRNDIYNGAPNIKEVETIRMVITHRFLGKEQDTHYYPYGAVVYPTGMLGQKEILYFTRPLIKQIVQRGFSNEQEDLFAYMMKKDFIIEEGINSYGYASEEEIRSFNESIKRRGHNIVSDNLKLTTSELRGTVSDVTGAIDDYIAFSINPFEEELLNVKGMNSDFLAELKTMIEDLDESNQTVTNDMEEVVNKTIEILDTLEDMDKDVAGAMGISEE